MLRETEVRKESKDYRSETMSDHRFSETAFRFDQQEIATLNGGVILYAV